MIYCHKGLKMKRILLFITLSLVALYAKPCMTDIYTLNGVNTSDISINGKASEARENMKRLKKFMLYWGNPITRLDPQKNGKEYQFRYVYNPSYGLRDDMLETYYQLKESGQISEGYFTFILNITTGDLTIKEAVKKYKEIVSRYERDVQGIYNAYNTSSFSQKHNLLLVAHSQGNLMGNKIYTMLTDAQKKKFRMVSVGTPANHVMKPDQTAPYVTARDDFVINGVYGALSGNVDGIGHNFINVYLGSSFEARTQIALYVKSAYDNLIQTTSCAQYDFTRVWMPTFGLLNVYGSVDNVDELVGEITLEQSDAILDNNTGRYACPKGNDSVYWGDDNYIGINWTYNYKDNRDNNWIPGQYITSRSSLDDRSDTNDTVRKDTKCVTISLNKDGDLYNVIYDMFPEKQ